jgi:hypothetical protein
MAGYLFAIQYKTYCMIILFAPVIVIVIVAVFLIFQARKRTRDKGNH